MLNWQFIAQNLHFSISLFAALVCFAVFWLYFDAWTNKHNKKEVYKWLGFLLLCFSFLAYGALVEQTALRQSRLANILEPIFWLLHIGGYGLIIIGQLVDPLQAKPNLRPATGTAPQPVQSTPSQMNALMIGLGSGVVKLLAPLGSLAIGSLYLRRATTGLERHLKPVAYAFFCLSVFDLLSLSSILRKTQNPILYGWVAPYESVWVLAHLFLLLGVSILGWWVWHYLTKRIQSQLFMILTGATVAIFLLATVSFTFLLMGSQRSGALSNLETAANTLSYAINSKKAETAASAQIITQNPAIAAAVVNKDHQALVNLTQDFLSTNNQSSLVIVDASAQVLLRGEDPSQYGNSLSSNLLIRRALIGEKTSTISTKQGVLAPLVYANSASPIRDGSGQVIGVVVTGLTLDNSLVDGIKHSTGLDTTVYAQNVRSATTLLAADGKSRLIGVKEPSNDVNNRVLKNGQTFKGNVSISNKPYFGVYAPMKDSENSTVGMLFVGSPQVELLETAGRSVQMTFLLAVSLIVIAAWPAFVVARYIEKQIS